MLHISVFGEVGYFAIVAAFLLAILQCVFPLFGVLTNRSHWQRLAPSLAFSQALATCIAFLCLAASFYFNDFSLSYVAQHANSLMPWYYKLSATWGGHEGSLLLWVTILSVWGALVSLYSNVLSADMRARVLVMLAFIQLAMLALVIFSSSPFDRLLPFLPVDGADLNPLLQDPGLIIHPPILYMGYIGLSVPFAFAIAALWAGRFDAAWARWTRPWTLCAWGFLTLGIAIGSWWAYYELGWGGWWFWDPVENAALMPWLVATALIHSLAVVEKRGAFKAWTVLLAILAFALSLLGTFLVRSGVLNSVHAFAADPTRGLFILVIFSVIVGSALLLFALRGWCLSTESQASLRSRETLLVFNNIILLVATAVVFLGTLYPIVLDAFGLSQVSVGAPYFNTLLVPLSWLLLLFLALAPIIRWKQDTQPLLGVSLAIAVSASVCAIIITWVVTGKLAALTVLLTVGLSLWVLFFMLKDIKNKTRHATTFLVGLKRLRLSYFAMLLAHFGVLVLCVGIGFTAHMESEKSVALKIGDAVKIEQTPIFSDNAYVLKLLSVNHIQKKNYQATRAVVQIVAGKKQIATLTPEKRQYVVKNRMMTEVAIHSTIWRDLYIALGDTLEMHDNKHKQQRWVLRFYHKPFVGWLWFGAIMMALGGFLAALDKRYYRATV